MRRAIVLVVIGMVIGAGFVNSEWVLRGRVRQQNRANPDLWRMILYTRHVTRHPYGELSFRLYGYETERLAAADLRFNNRGFISDRNFEFARQPNEFRIVAIGGEQTASTVVNRSWPDLLEDELNARDPSTQYKVFNIAWPDAGPEHYIKYWKKFGMEFAPDLVIVNYVETDFFRTLHGAPLTFHWQPITHCTIRYQVGPETDDVAVTTAACLHGSTARSFRDRMVVPGRPYGFFVARAFAEDRHRVRALQVQVVGDMIDGALPAFGSLTFRGLRGRPTTIDVSAVRNFDPLPSQGPDRERLVQFGISNFGWLARHVPHLVLTHSFIYYDLGKRFELTELMLARDPRIRVVDMRSRIPAGTPDEELRSWYMIPHMGEKWSQRGHEVYARMMAGVVMDWRDLEIGTRTKTTGAGPTRTGRLGPSTVPHLR